MRRSATVRGPLGLLLAAIIMLLWLFAAFFPAIVIIGIALWTDTLDQWEPWVAAIVLQIIWWWWASGD